MSGRLKAEAYSHIYEKLVTGEFPPGARLSNRLLAAEIGVSVIPVREAIAQLQSEGFVEHRSGEGAFVPYPSLKELFEIYDLREAIECHAAANAAERVSQADLANLGECVDEAAAIVQASGAKRRLNPNSNVIARWSNADARFHDLVVQATGNERALEYIRRLREMSRVFGTQVAYQPTEQLRQSLAEHRSILQALEQGDRTQAHLAMSGHIRRGFHLLSEAHCRHRMSNSIE